MTTVTEEDNAMWIEGTIGIPNEGTGKMTVCHYWVKHFNSPSEEYGIDGGRISKMQIKIDGRTTLNYDRGWDMEPEDEATQLAFQILMKQYN